MATRQCVRASVTCYVKTKQNYTPGLRTKALKPLSGQCSGNKLLALKHCHVVATVVASAQLWIYNTLWFYIKVQKMKNCMSLLKDVSTLTTNFKSMFYLEPLFSCVLNFPHECSQLTNLIIDSGTCRTFFPIKPSYKNARLKYIIKK